MLCLRNLLLKTLFIFATILMIINIFSYEFLINIFHANDNGYLFVILPIGRIGRRGLAEELQTVAEKVEEAGQVQAEEDDIVADAPEEFLDPIMSHLMTDPVILPSSKVSVDG